MAEVGVLNLTIHDNSEEAGKGLQDLADALSAVKAAKQNFSLQGVNTQISNIVNSVKENSKVIGELGKLFNGLAQFGKIKNLSIPVDQFSALKEAINGMTIGQTGTQIENIRKALAGDWKTENINSMMSSMNALQTAAAGWQASGTAKTITDVANAIEKYTKAYNKMPPESPFTLVVSQLQSQASSMMESANTIRVGIEKASGETANLFGDIIKKHAAGGSGAAEEAEKLGNNYSAGFGIGISQGVDAVISACVEIVNAAVQTVRNKAEIRSPSHVTKELGEQTAAGYAEGIRAGTGDVKAAAQEMVYAVTNTTKGITNIEGPFEKVEETTQHAQQMLGTVRDLNKAVSSGMERISESAGKVDYSSLDITKYLSTPIESLRDRYAVAGNTIDAFKESVSASIPVFRDYRDTVMGLESKKDIAGFSRKSGQDLLEAAKVAQTGSSKMTEVMEETQQATENVGQTLQRVIPLVDAFGRKMDSSLPMIMQDGTVIPAMTTPQPQSTGVVNQMREIRDMGPSIEDVKRNIDELVSSLSAAQATNMSKAFSIEEQIQQFSDLENNMRQVLAADQMAGMVNEQEMARRVVAIRLVHLEQEKLYDQLLKIKEESSGISKIKDSFVSIKGAVKNLLSPLARIAKQFTNIARRMMIRAIIRQFTSGLKEGIENVYNYSKAIGSDFAPAMDSAATSLQQMKNSLGAAVAPAIQALIPILQTVVNWFITMVNYANQFIALMNGQSTWIRAIPATATAFGKQEKAAKKAGSAVKDLLADWDELNIIQSETSGANSGAGTSTAEDYLNMFETVATFDKKISDITDTIKRNLNQIKETAVLIGSALALWKFSSAFTGTLAALLGLAEVGLTAAVVFEVSTMFTREYLKTGNVAYLVGDLLTTLVGSVFASRILEKVIGGGAGEIGIPLIFTISAAATIITNVTETDVSALDEKSIAASVTSALEGGVAAGYLAHIAGASVGQSLLGGAIGTVATFGIAIGLKADAQVIADDITQENIEAKLIAIAALGISGAATGAAAGGGAAGAAGMAMLFGGVPVATFGVAIGLNAINEVVDGSEITADVIKKNFLSGGLVGAGVMISTFAVAGATTAGIVGVTAAALTVAALFVIEAVIADQPAKVKWGNYNATKEEIESFVNNELYKNPPSVTISTINATIEPLGALKSALNKSTAEAIGTIYALSVGILTTPEDLKVKIDNLISDFNNASQQYQNTLQVALSLAPVESGNGTDVSDQIVSNSQERWTELNSIMAGLGEQLADAYKIAYDARMKGNIDEVAETTIKELSDMMTKVANAISSGQARAKASHAIKMEMLNFSQDTMGSLLDEIKTQRDNLIKELTEARSKSAEGILAQQYAYEELAAYRLEEVHGDVTDETYMHYVQMAEQAKADYLAMLANMQAEIEKAADNLMDAETYAKLREAALGFMGRKVNYTATEFKEYDEEAEAYRDWWQELLSGDNAKSNIQSQMMVMIQGAFQGADRETVKKAIEANILKLSDFIDKETMDAFAASNGITGEYKDIFDKYVYELLGIDPNGNDVDVEVEVGLEFTEENINEARKIIDGLFPNLKKTLEVHDIPVVEHKDEKPSAAEEVAEAVDESVKRNLPSNWPAGGGGGANLMLEYDKYTRWMNGPLGGSLYRVNTNGTTPTYYGGVSGFNGAGEGDVSGDVQKGMQDTNETIRNGNDETNRLLRLILAKNFQVNLNPTSGWGFFNQRSNDMAGEVTGYNA